MRGAGRTSNVAQARTSRHRLPLAAAAYRCRCRCRLPQQPTAAAAAAACRSRSRCRLPFHPPGGATCALAQHSKSTSRVVIQGPVDGGRVVVASIPRCPDARMCGRADVRTCGRADSRMCGRADSRMCGRADSRMCGCADARESAHPGILEPCSGYGAAGRGPRARAGGAQRGDGLSSGSNPYARAQVGIIAPALPRPS